MAFHHHTSTVARHRELKWAEMLGLLSYNHWWKYYFQNIWACIFGTIQGILIEKVFIWIVVATFRRALAKKQKPTWKMEKKADNNAIISSYVINNRQYFAFFAQIPHILSQAFNIKILSKFVQEKKKAILYLAICELFIRKMCSSNFPS